MCLFKKIIFNFPVHYLWVVFSLLICGHALYMPDMTMSLVICGENILPTS